MRMLKLTSTISDEPIYINSELICAVSHHEADVRQVGPIPGMGERKIPEHTGIEVMSGGGS